MGVLVGYYDQNPKSYSLLYVARIVVDVVIVADVVYDFLPISQLSNLSWLLLYPVAHRPKATIGVGLERKETTMNLGTYILEWTLLYEEHMRQLGLLPLVEKTTIWWKLYAASLNRKARTSEE